MRKQDELLVPHGPDAPALLQEERDKKLRLEDARRTEEERTDLNYAKRAVEEGEEYIDSRGKRIRGLGKKPLASAVHYHTALSGGMTDSFTRSALISLSWAMLKGVQEFYSAVPAAVAAISAPVFLSVRYEDQSHIYGETLVHEKTSYKLRAELDEVESISQRMEALDIEEDPFAPWKENELWDQRKDKIERYEMRTLPDESGYVHCFSRVEKLDKAFSEAKTNDAKAVEPGVPVMVCYLKPQVQDGLRVYAKVGDAFDDKPAETVATGDHRAEPPARPIQPPGFHYVGS